MRASPNAKPPVKVADAIVPDVGVRYLTIVRHAKASRPSPGAVGLRPRAEQAGRASASSCANGRLDANALGRFGPTTALVSSAARTRETFRRAFDGTAFVDACEYSDLIYNGRRDVSAEDLLIDLAAIDPVTTSLLVVAHNPTVHELVLTLAREAPKCCATGNYPLGGAFVLALRDDRPVGLDRYEVVASYVPD